MVLSILTDTPHSSNATYNVLNHIKNIHVNQRDLFVKYDFENLFPSLRLEPVCLILYRFLLENVPYSNLCTQLLRDVAHTICYDSFFVFNRTFYQQEIGVPIGSPLAGVLAEITLRSLEPKIINELQPSLKFYTRYVDDVITQWENINDIDKLAEAFTIEAYGLKLKKEQQSLKEINYLDIKIVVEEDNIVTSVY